MRALGELAEELPSQWRPPFWGAVIIGGLTCVRVVGALPFLGLRGVLPGLLAIPLATAAGAAAGGAWVGLRPLRRHRTGVYLSWLAVVGTFFASILVPLAQADPDYFESRYLLPIFAIGTLFWALVLSASLGDPDDVVVRDPPAEADTLLREAIERDLAELTATVASTPSRLVELDAVRASEPGLYLANHWRRVISYLGRTAPPGPARRIAARRAQRVLDATLAKLRRDA